MGNGICLIDCINQDTGKEIAMSGDDFVYLDTKEKVEVEIVEKCKLILVENLNNERIAKINNKAGEIIYAKYSREKQFNISNLLTPYTEREKEEMFMFIETVRGIAKNAKESGIEYEEINWGGLDVIG